MRKKHEQSVIDGVYNAFHRVAHTRNRELVRCSMDGQDAIYGGDYIFTDSSRFLLVEFKYEESDLCSEKKKDKRRTLCLRLDHEEVYRKLSLKCHYVAWSTKRHTRTVLFNRYYPQICNQRVFGPTSGLSSKEPELAHRKEADDIFEGFLDQKEGSTYYEFRKYTDWLSSLTGAGGVTDMELIMDDPKSNQLKFLEFPSIESFKLWMEYYSKDISNTKHNDLEEPSEPDSFGPQI